MVSNENKKNKTSLNSEESYQLNPNISNPTKPKYTIDEKFLKKFEEYAFSLDIIDISYVSNIEEYYFKDVNLDYSSAILVTIEMDQKIIDEGPGVKSKGYNDILYNKIDDCGYKLLDYLRFNGYEAEIAHPYERVIKFPRICEKGNLGYIGKHGLLISPKFGPRQKIVGILVNIKNLPSPSSNKYKWIREYCNNCNSCIESCPYNALSVYKEGERFRLDRNKCIGSVEGCALCVKGCPFYKKGYMKVKEICSKLEEKGKIKKDIV